MGFSSALQGRAAHEALVARQDTELRLLETMKRVLTQKAKCDRDYSVAIAAVAQQGSKIDRADDLQGIYVFYLQSTISTYSTLSSMVLHVWRFLFQFQNFYLENSSP